MLRSAKILKHLTKILEIYVKLIAIEKVYLQGLKSVKLAQKLFTLTVAAYKTNIEVDFGITAKSQYEFRKTSKAQF